MRIFSITGISGMAAKTLSRQEVAGHDLLLMAVHCRPWKSAGLALEFEVGFLAVISTAWLSLADPLQSVELSKCWRQSRH